jgi:hypothetical protein
MAAKPASAPLPARRSRNQKRRDLGQELSPQRHLINAGVVRLDTSVPLLPWLPSVQISFVYFSRVSPTMSLFVSPKTKGAHLHTRRALSDLPLFFSSIHCRATAPKGFRVSPQ